MSIPRSRRWIRVILAGPVAIIAALVVMAGMPLWLPTGAAGIDNLVLPLVLMPLIWAGFFFHACLDQKLKRIGLVAFSLIAIHASLIGHKLWQGPSPLVEAAHD